MSASFILPAVAPFRLDLTVWALRRRNSNLIDQWDGKHYIRLFNLENQTIKVLVGQNNDKKNPSILVSTNIRISKKIQNELSCLLVSMLGLTQDMRGFYRIAKQDLQLKPLMMKFKGVKPPRFPSIFEALCNAIACQQLSLDAGLQILNRFAQNYGKCIHHNESIYYAFPRPQDVAHCNSEELRKLGFSIKKSETLIRIANNILEQKVEWDNLVNLSDMDAMKFLCSLKGIGRWSAEYTLLRGLGRIHLFPGDDIGAHRNLQKYLHFRGTINHARVNKILSHLYPYAGLVYFHLVLQTLAEKNWL